MIRYYLKHEDERLKLVKQIKNIIIKQHTYSIRAQQLNTYLKTINIELKPKKMDKLLFEFYKRNKKNNNNNNYNNENTYISNNYDTISYKVNINSKKDNYYNYNEINNNNNNNNIKTTSLCIGIRTIEKQFLFLEVLVHSLVIQYEKSKYKNNIIMKIFIISTENVTEKYKNQLKILTTTINNKFGYLTTFVVFENFTRKFKNQFYGYDSTDLLLKYFINNYKKSISENNYKKKILATSYQPIGIVIIVVIIIIVVVVVFIVYTFLVFHIINIANTTRVILTLIRMTITTKATIIIMIVIMKIIIKKK